MRALARHTSQASQEAAHRESSYSLSCSITMAEAESPAARARGHTHTVPGHQRIQAIC